MGAGGFGNFLQDLGLSDQAACRDWLKKTSASPRKNMGTCSVYSHTLVIQWEASAQQRILCRSLILKVFGFLLQSALPAKGSAPPEPSPLPPSGRPGTAAALQLEIKSVRFLFCICIMGSESEEKGGFMEQD